MHEALSTVNMTCGQTKNTMGSFEFSQNALKGSAQPQNGTYVG